MEFEGYTSLEDRVMEKVFGSPMARHFYTLVILCLLVIGLLRYLVLPLLCGEGQECGALATNWYGVAADMLEGLLTTVMVTVAMGAVLFWLFPFESRDAFRILQPLEISATLEKAMRDTSLWMYKGGTGTYLKAVTLPLNAQHANRSRIARDLSLVILDPTNGTLCSEYARYRRALAAGSNKSGSWKIERVREELYATILTVVGLREDAPLLRIRLFLSDSFSSFRYDLSSSSVVITNEDPRWPAIIASNSHHFYSVYKDELMVSASQARELDMTKLSAGVGLESITEEWAVLCLKELGLLIPELSKADLVKIAALVKDPRNPYA